MLWFATDSCAATVDLGWHIGTHGALVIDLLDSVGQIPVPEPLTEPLEQLVKRLEDHDGKLQEGRPPFTGNRHDESAFIDCTLRCVHAVPVLPLSPRTFRSGPHQLPQSMALFGSSEGVTNQSLPWLNQAPPHQQTFQNP
jgi:hypothetical protein